MCNPCCGRDLHNAAKTVAVFDVVFSTLELAAAMVFESGPVTILSTESDDPESRDKNYKVSLTLLFGMCLFIMRVMQLACSILLLYGVVEKNYKKCKTWFIFSLVVVALAAFQIIFELAIRDNLLSKGSPSSLNSYLRLGVPCLELLVAWWLIWVIAAFMIQLKKEESNLQSLEKGRQSKEEMVMIRI